jgi:hypothetical protein
MSSGLRREKEGHSPCCCFGESRGMRKRRRRRKMLLRGVPSVWEIR